MKALKVAAATGIAVLVAATGVASALSGVAAGRGTTVKVTEREMAIVASTKKVPPGKVTLVVTNRGTVEHELIVMRWNGNPKGLPVSHYKADERRAVGEVPELAPGKTGRVTLTLSAGKYLLICNVPGHYMLGMMAPLTVG